MHHIHVLPWIALKAPPEPPRRRRKPAAGGNRRVSDEMILQMWADHDAGMKAIEISRKHGVGYAYTLSVLHRGIRDRGLELQACRKRKE